MSETISPVLVVGSGPSGLIMALCLCMNGIPVRIIEKKPTYPIGQRGSGIHPRTLEIHHLLGTLDKLMANGTPLQRIRQFCPIPNGDKVMREMEMVEYIEPTPSIPYSNAIMLGQNQQEEILRQKMAEYGCHVELNMELQSFEQHDNYVSVTIARHDKDGQDSIEHAKYRWLIGADGARGMMRKALGFSFLGETCFGDNLVLGDIHVPNIDESLSRDYWCSWGDMKDTVVLLRPTTDQDIGNFIITGPGVKDCVSPLGREDFLRIFESVTGRSDVQFGDLIWMGNYRPNIRMVDKFGENRAYLVGDAAHVHSPTGGQGMNSSIQDSFNLAWKLALVEKGLASKSLLQTYTDERIPVIAHMLQVTTALLDKTRKGEDGAWKRGGALSMLGVNYRTSPIVLDERSPELPEEERSPYGTLSAGVLRAGDRAPDAPGLIKANGQKTRLFDLFDPRYHTALIFAKDTTGITSALEKYPSGTIMPFVIVKPDSINSKSEFTLIDGDGHVAKEYGLKEDQDTIVIVRPDGFIGAITFDVAGLDRYFGRIFL